MKKVYRGLEYHKYRIGPIVLLLSFCLMVVFLSMCKPQYNEVEIHYDSDTVQVEDTTNLDTLAVYTKEDSIADESERYKYVESLKHN